MHGVDVPQNPKLAMSRGSPRRIHTKAQETFEDRLLRIKAHLESGSPRTSTVRGVGVKHSPSADLMTSNMHTVLTALAQN